VPLLARPAVFSSGSALLGEPAVAPSSGFGTPLSAARRVATVKHAVAVVRPPSERRTGATEPVRHAARSLAVPGAISRSNAPHAVGRTVTSPITVLPVRARCRGLACGAVKPWRMCRAKRDFLRERDFRVTLIERKCAVSSRKISVLHAQSSKCSAARRTIELVKQRIVGMVEKDFHAARRPGGPLDDPAVEFARRHHGGGAQTE